MSNAIRFVFLLVLFVLPLNIVSANSPSAAAINNMCQLDWVCHTNEDWTRGYYAFQQGGGQSAPATNAGPSMSMADMCEYNRNDMRWHDADPNNDPNTCACEDDCSHSDPETQSVMWWHGWHKARCLSGLPYNEFLAGGHCQVDFPEQEAARDDNESDDDSTGRPASCDGDPPLPPEEYDVGGICFTADPGG